MRTTFGQRSIWTFVIASHFSYAQTALQRAGDGFQALQSTWYNTSTGLWNTAGWWNGANCLTMIANLALVDSTLNDQISSIFTTTYNTAPSVNPAPGVEKSYVSDSQGTSMMPSTQYPSNWPTRSSYFESRTSSGYISSDVPSSDTNATAWLDGYYDDDGWWALAWIAAYDVSKNPIYLSLAQNIFEDLTDAWPTSCGNGGIWWNNIHSYINAIPNELFLSIAASLANRVGSADKAYYVDWAIKEWSWFYASGMINSQNVINDGLNTACENNNDTVWSYNQGVVLGGLAELYLATNDATYLSNATAIASAAIAALTTSDGVLHDVCEPNCAPDATQFKGVMLRNMFTLVNVLGDNYPSQKTQYLDFVKANADSIWASDRDANNLLSITWDGPFVAPANASTHCSAMDALVAAAALGI